MTGWLQRIGRGFARRAGYNAERGPKPCDCGGQMRPVLTRDGSVRAYCCWQCRRIERIPPGRPRVYLLPPDTRTN